MSPTIAYIAPIILLIVIILASLFLSNRLAYYFGVISVKKWRITILSMLIVSLVSMITFTTTPHLPGRAIFMFSCVVIGYLLYLLIVTLTIEALNLLLHIPARSRGYLGISVTAGICLYGIWQASNPVVKEVVIPIPGLQKEIRAVHLTDIHLGNFRGQRFLSKVVDRVSELDPEVIFHTGDLFDAKAPLNEATLSPLTLLKAPHFFVEGNHDIEVGLQRVFDLVKGQGMTVLENELVIHEGLQIIGLKYMLADSASFDIHASAEKETIAQVLRRLPIDSNLPAIVLHHSPMGYQYASMNGAELMLAGHTHGGQMWPLTYIAESLFVYNNGYYQFEDMSMYVSQGIGTMFSPMRIGTQSEITLLKLVPKNE